MRAFSASRCRLASCSVSQRAPRWKKQCRCPRARSFVEEDDMDDKVAEFLKNQDMTERGLEAGKDPDKVIGADEVDDEQAKAYCRDIVRVLRRLNENRDMDNREAKLIIQIDDPRKDEARKLGIEDSMGVSRDELGQAMEEVAAGQVPKDRIALKLLHAELIQWPYLEDDDDTVSRRRKVAAAASAAKAPTNGSPSPTESSAAESSTGFPTASAPLAGGVVGKGKGLMEQLPDWMGYSFLYAVTLVPVMIVVVVIAILFFSSLK